MGFKFHRAVQVIGLLLVLIGLGLALPSTQASGHFKFLHGGLGLAICLLGFQQPFNALVRPHKDKSKPPSTARRVWEEFHRNLGRLALVLALVNIPLGLYLYLAADGVKVAWFVYTGLLVLAYVCAELGK